MRSVEIESADQIPLRDALAMAVERKRAFVDKLHWELPTYAGEPYELDQYDTGLARYFLAREDGILRYSARLLDLEHSMVRDLWPAMLPFLRPGAVEVSRFVAHSGARAAHLFPLRPALRALGVTSCFGVADRRMLAVYKRFLKWEPDCKTAFAEYGGLFLVQWDMRDRSDVDRPEPGHTSHGSCAQAAE